MSNELTPQQNFQELLKNRIREDIGKLMPDEALRDLIRKAVNDTFFNDEKEYSEYYNGCKLVGSWFKHTILKQIEPIVKEEMERIIKVNEPLIKEILQEEIKDALPALLVGAIHTGIYGKFQSETTSQTFTLLDKLRQKGIQIW